MIIRAKRKNNEVKEGVRSTNSDTKGEKRLAESKQEDSQRMGRRDFVRVGAVGAAGISLADHKFKALAATLYN